MPPSHHSDDEIAHLEQLAMAAIGEYLGRSYQQIRKQPLTIVEETTTL